MKCIREMPSFQGTSNTYLVTSSIVVVRGVVQVPSYVMVQVNVVYTYMYNCVYQITFIGNYLSLK